MNRPPILTRGTIDSGGGGGGAGGVTFYDVDAVAVTDGTPPDSTLDILVPHPAGGASAADTVAEGARVLDLATGDVLIAHAASVWTLAVPQPADDDLIRIVNVTFTSNNSFFEGLLFKLNGDGNPEPVTNFVSVQQVAASASLLALPMTRSVDHLNAGGPFPFSWPDGVLTGAPASNGVVIFDGWGYTDLDTPGPAALGSGATLADIGANAEAEGNQSGIRFVAIRTADPVAFPGPVRLVADTNGAQITGVLGESGPVNEMELTELYETVELVGTVDPDSGVKMWRVVNQYRTAP